MEWEIKNLLQLACGHKLEFYIIVDAHFIMPLNSCLLVILMSFLISYYLTYILFHIEKKILFIKKLKGYRWMERYEHVLTWMVLVYLLLLMRTGGLASASLYICIVAADLLIWILWMIRYENRQLSLQLKGEQI